MFNKRNPAVSWFANREMVGWSDWEVEAAVQENAYFNLRAAHCSALAKCFENLTDVT